jgi:hypothetical protein
MSYRVIRPRTRRDANEGVIAAALRSAGARTWELDQPFDLLTLYGGVFRLLEVKRPGEKPSERQQELLGTLQALGAPVYVVRTPEDALQAIGAIR